MTDTRRLVVNTIAQYIKTIFNVLLGLFATRIVLQHLGVSDFGIYNLIAGVIAFLAFISSALANSTQRFLSFYFQSDSIDKLKRIFTNSIFLHIIVGFGLFLIIEFIGIYLWDGFLSIPYNRLYTAQLIYHLTAVILFLSFITTPYRAVCISHENFIGISILDMINALLKLGAAVALFLCTSDKLALYTWGILFATFVYGISFVILCRIKYPEVKHLSFTFISWKECKELTSFMGWSIYSQGCIVGRTQGLAIVFNRALGTVINASYGLALQINGSIRFLSQSLINAMSPQIIKAEGLNDRKRVIQLSNKASKYAFLLLALAVIPCWAEMSQLLKLWLHAVPEGALVFCRMMLLATLIDQLSLPLKIVNSATGRIKSFVLFIDTVKLLTLVIAAWLLHVGYSYTAVMWAFVGIEIFCSIERVVYMYFDINFNIMRYLKEVVVPCIVGLLSLIIPTFLIVFLCEASFYRIICIFVSSGVSLVATLYFFILNSEEKSRVKQFLLSKINRK